MGQDAVVNRFSSFDFKSKDLERYKRSFPSITASDSTDYDSVPTKYYRRFIHLTAIKDRGGWKCPRLIGRKEIWEYRFKRMKCET